MEMVRISAAVMGIEFCYAAETAFVSPILLKIGVQHRLMTLIWCLSPTIGFFLTPVLGSLSDKCRLSMGRRRPFILLLSIGLLTGNLLHTYVCTLQAYVDLIPLLLRCYYTQIMNNIAQYTKFNHS